MGGSWSTSDKSSRLSGHTWSASEPSAGSPGVWDMDPSFPHHWTRPSPGLDHIQGGRPHMLSSLNCLDWSTSLKTNLLMRESYDAFTSAMPRFQALKLKHSSPRPNRRLLCQPIIGTIMSKQIDMVRRVWGKEFVTLTRQIKTANPSQ